MRATLQVGVCSGYDLCHIGVRQLEYYILTVDLCGPQKCVKLGNKSFAWCIYVTCTLEFETVLLHCF